jgi:Uncharacterized protein conserved in bacteria, prophage-related
MQAKLKSLEDAVAAVGSASELARKLGIKPAAVLQWKRVPAERCLEVERLTGISRHDLRPDVYGSAPERVLS